MPAPLALAIPALLEAAEVTVVALGSMMGVIALDEMVEESDKDKEDAKSTTADSTKPCEICPAIPKVFPEPEPFHGEKVNLYYQMRICGTQSMHHMDGKTTIEEFVFRDPRLFNFTKKVKFDGWKPKQCLFLEAKGRIDQFFDKNGEPFSWYEGNEQTQEQARRQQDAIGLCDYIPQCHWHFMQPVSSAYYKIIFKNYPNITVFHTI